MKTKGQNIENFKVGQIITRLERAEIYNKAYNDNLGVTTDVLQRTDGSYMGDRLQFKGIANNRIYFLNLSNSFIFNEKVSSVDLENWQDKLVGRKIYHAGIPSIIDRYVDDGEIVVRTEDGKPYEIYGYKKEELKEDPENYDDEWKDKDRIHITDNRIYWFRD